MTDKVHELHSMTSLLNGYSAIPLVLSSEQAFSLLATWMGWEFSQSSSSDSSVFNDSSFNSSLLLYFTISSKKDTSCTYTILLRNLPCKISNFITCKFYLLENTRTQFSQVICHFIIGITFPLESGTFLPAVGASLPPCPIWFFPGVRAADCLILISNKTKYLHLVS